MVIAASIKAVMNTICAAAITNFRRIAYYPFSINSNARITEVSLNASQSLDYLTVVIKVLFNICFVLLYFFLSFLLSLQASNLENVQSDQRKISQRRAEEEQTKLMHMWHRVRSYWWKANTFKTAPISC